MVGHAGADDLVEHLAELADPLDREPMEIEVSQAVFPLEIARMAQAGLADVDRRHMSVGLAQRVDREPATCRSRRPGSLDLPAAPPLATEEGTMPAATGFRQSSRRLFRLPIGDNGWLS